MYNPLKILDDAFRKNGNSESFKKHRLHPSLSWFEVAAFLSFIPGMLFFLTTNTIAVAFILAGAAVLAVHEAEKNRIINAYLILIIFCLIPSIFFLIFAIVDQDINNQALIGSLYYLLLWLWGSFGTFKHQTYVRKSKS